MEGGLKGVVFMILLVSAVVIGGGEYITDVGYTVGAGVFPENISVINKMAEVSSVLGTADSSLRQSGTSSGSLFDLPAIFITGMWSTLKLLFIQLPDIFFSIITTVFTILPLPWWLSSLIVGSFWAGVIFAMLKAGMGLEV